MPNISEMKQSKFLTKGDVGTGLLVTITGCQQENVALPGAGEELKWALTFQETDKPWILNSTNAQIAASIFASQETEDWIGKKLVLYTDPNISYAGRVIGGIRCRAPRAPAPAKSAPTKPAPAARPISRQAPEPESAPPQDYQGGAEPPDDCPF